jgi:glucose/mannose transport system substrate-binding protein
MPGLLRLPSVLIMLMGMVLAGGLTACTGFVPEPTPLPPNPTSTPVGARQVEVYTTWTTAAEAEAFAALVEVFTAEHPDIALIHPPRPGSSADEVAAAVRFRLQAGDSPDSWQGRGSRELIADYAEAGFLEPVNFLFVRQGWTDVLPPDVLPYLGTAENLYVVPVAVRRLNLLWYHADRLAGVNGVVPTDFDTLLADLEALKAAGMAKPLALGGTETALHLFETVLLAQTGPGVYRDLVAGRGDWAGPEVGAAIERFAQLLNYADMAERTWSETAASLLAGQTAFLVAGDGVRSAFPEQSRQPHGPIGWTLMPGTDGVFLFATEGFVLAGVAPHRREAIAWLTTVGSQAGQDALNPRRYTLSPRRDADPARYDAYGRMALRDWQTHTLVGSLTYGVAADATWRTAVAGAVEAFLRNRDAGLLQRALVNACRDLGPCP